MVEHAGAAPSSWLVRWAHLVPAGAQVLDLACGRGRHARWLAARGCQVSAIDRDAEALAALAGLERITARLADLEGDTWPIEDGGYDAVVVTNYLYRPRVAALVQALRAGGVLLYETFMVGNEQYGRPRSPQFLLRENELLEVFGASLATIAFEQGAVDRPDRAIVQRYVGIRSARAAGAALAT